MSLLIFLTSCGVNKAVVKTETLYWPQAPNIPRYVHETTIRTARDIKVIDMAQKFQDMMLGLSDRKNDAFAKPYDVAARKGNIVITDSVTRVALMFNVPERKVYPIGQRKGEGELKKPMGVALDAQRFIYVSDVSDKVVKVYDPRGRFLRLIGFKGEFEKPVDVAVSDEGDRIYVVDAGGIESNRHQVIIFDRAGKRLKTIGTRGTAPGNFNLPTQAVVSGDGTLYVLDAGNFRVQVFDRDGSFLRTFGKVGRKFGDLARPRGIAVDDTGNIYVTDAMFRNFQIFNPEGKLLMWIGNGDLFDTPGNLVLPAGIAIDETNRIYVVDQLLRKLEVYRKLRDTEIAKLTAKPIAATVVQQSEPVVVKTQSGATRNKVESATSDSSSVESSSVKGLE